MPRRSTPPVALRRSQPTVVSTPRWVVANKVGGDADLASIRDGLGVEPAVVVPADPGVATADLRAEAPFEVAPDGPAVAAVRALAGRITAVANGDGRRSAQAPR